MKIETMKIKELTQEKPLYLQTSTDDPNEIEIESPHLTILVKDNEPGCIFDVA